MNILTVLIQELFETFKKVSDFIQYIFGVGMRGPLIAFFLAALVLAGKGSKGLKLGKWFDIKF